MKKARDEQRASRVGRSILLVIVEHIVEFIPGVGPLASMGFDFIKIAVEEYEKEKEGQLTREEIIEALRSLTYAEASAVVDSVLDSPKGQAATQTLSQSQRTEVRNRLINIPNEIDQILHDLAVQDERQEKARKQREVEEKAKKLAELEVKLKEQLRSEKFTEAYFTVWQILDIKPFHSDAIKAELYLIQKLAVSPKINWVGILYLLFLLAFMAIVTSASFRIFFTMTNGDYTFLEVLILAAVIGGFTGLIVLFFHKISLFIRLALICIVLLLLIALNIYFEFIYPSDFWFFKF